MLISCVKIFLGYSSLVELNYWMLSATDFSKTSISSKKVKEGVDIRFDCKDYLCSLQMKSKATLGSYPGKADFYIVVLSRTNWTATIDFIGQAGPRPPHSQFLTI